MGKVFLEGWRILCPLPRINLDELLNIHKKKTQFYHTILTVTILNLSLLCPRMATDMHQEQLHVTAMVCARWSSFEYKHGEKKHVMHNHEIAQRSCLVGHLFCFTCLIIKKSRGSIYDSPCCCQKHIQCSLRAATAAAKSCDRCQENQR